MLNVAVLGSGRGSNFGAILGAMQCGTLPDVRVKVVISNNSNAGILEIARANAIPAVYISQRSFSTEEEFVGAMLKTLQQYEVNFIVLAGYMKHVHSRVIAEYRNRIINVHPALLPKHGGKGMFGMYVHEAVVANNERVSGATVHVVDEEFDRGPIVLQERVELAPDDTPENVAAKVLDVEHHIYPRALQMFAEGKITVTDNRVVVHSLVS